MTFPTVTEITPRMEPVTPDPFIASELQHHFDRRGVGTRPQVERTVAG